jgi:hypothetical protein
MADSPGNKDRLNFEDILVLDDVLGEDLRGNDGLARGCID